MFFLKITFHFDGLFFSADKACFFLLLSKCFIVLAIERFDLASLARDGVNVHDPHQIHFAVYGKVNLHWTFRQLTSVHVIFNTCFEENYSLEIL